MIINKSIFIRPGLKNITLLYKLNPIGVGGFSLVLSYFIQK